MSRGLLLSVGCQFLAILSFDTSHAASVINALLAFAWPALAVLLARFARAKPQSPLPHVAKGWPQAHRFYLELPRRTCSQSVVTRVGDTFQIFSQYSRMARSEENLPARAVLSIDMRVQRSWSAHAALTRS